LGIIQVWGEGLLILGKNKISKVKAFLLKRKIDDQIK